MNFKISRKVFKSPHSYNGRVIAVICFNGDAVLPEYYNNYGEFEEVESDEYPAGKCDTTIYQCDSLPLTCEHYIELQRTIDDMQCQLNEFKALARNVATAVFSRINKANPGAIGQTFVVADCIVEMPNEEDVYWANIYPAITPK